MRGYTVELTVHSNRRLDNKLNAFEGLHRSRYFLVVLAIIAVVEVVFIQFGGSTLHVAPLNAAEWAICISLGFMTIPSGMLIRLFPEDTSSPDDELRGRRSAPEGRY